MAGTFDGIMNKVRPGAYLDFVSKPSPMIKIGDRGIATVAMDLNWGAEGEVISLKQADIFSNSYMELIGDTDRLIPELALVNNAQELLIYRLNKGGTKATVVGTVNTELTSTAVYNGTFGNTLSVVVTEATNGYFQVNTFTDGYEADKQRVKTIADLMNNPYVVFSATDTGVFVGDEVIKLTGGTNGTTAPETGYPDYFEAIRHKKWHCMAIVQDHDVAQHFAKSYVRDLRDNQGKKVMVALKSDNENFEGIVTSENQGYKTKRAIVDPDVFTMWMAGVTAGATMTESNTSRLIPDAIEIINPLSNDEIIEGIKNGYFLLAYRADGGIKVELDINAYHEFTPEKNEMFSKNKILRIIDTWNESVVEVFENIFMGKVANNEEGRAIFKAEIVFLGNEFQRLNAMQNFDGKNDIEIMQGRDLEDVVVTSNIQPVDVMEKLYMTVRLINPMG